MSYEKYFKSVSHLDVIDVYRVLDLFSVTDHALGHAAKKILLCGVRTGGKNEMQEIIEARDTLNRWIEIQAENAKADSVIMPNPVTGNWPASADERMEPIMQNGNDGDHYDDLEIIKDGIIVKAPGDVFIQTEDGETARYSAAGYAASKE